MKVATHLAEQTKNLVSVSISGLVVQVVAAVQFGVYEAKRDEEVEDFLMWFLWSFVTGTALPPFEQFSWQSWDRKQTLLNPDTLVKM